MSFHFLLFWLKTISKSLLVEIEVLIRTSPCVCSLLFFPNSLSDVIFHLLSTGCMFPASSPHSPISAIINEGNCAYSSYLSRNQGVPSLQVAYLLFVRPHSTEVHFHSPPTVKILLWMAVHSHSVLLLETVLVVGLSTLTTMHNLSSNMTAHLLVAGFTMLVVG